MPPAKVGKYEIQGVLGKGGMGIVYKAFDPAISRSVAIKAIAKASLDAAELQHVMSRFRHEARAAGRLTHPRIVQIYDYGEDDEVAYIVMELVNGKSLHEHLAQNASYDLREVGEIIRQLLDGLAHAHAQGVVHRDVKPSNIMINSDGRIKIGDLGIAHIESSVLTKLGDVLGTPHYMAPEQFLGTDTDALADLYSVGVIAYELLTGKKPFLGAAATVMQKVLNEPPVDPSQINPQLAPLVDEVVQKALAKKRERRYQSAPEFADAFRAAIEASLAHDGGTTAAVAPAAPGLLEAARLIRTMPVAPSALASSAEPQVRAPAAAAVPAVSDRSVNLDKSVRKARLLVIDDEERILTALKSLFRLRYHVFATTDGNKALDFVKKFPVHVIISDQRMPIMPGVELLRQSREISPSSVRILLTGYSDLAAIVGSINDGEVYRFVSKPWDNRELQQTVAEAVTIALELADTKAPAAALPQKMAAGVLVLDDDEELYRVTKELLGGLCSVSYAPNLDAALKVMQSQDVAVVIADVAAGHEDTTAMFKLLKQENPQILTIVVTSASDSELVIDLINQAQIFRFLNKPVNVKLLKQHAEAALERYAAFEQAPGLVRRHRVVDSQELRLSSLGQRILTGLRALHGRWFGAGGR
jgi:response regulator RpfG family c-di-GMP phosphodiesterase/tRNA A-37 threonylcarbamoyl transferase component Bud32